MENIDLDFAIKHWRAFVDDRIRREPEDLYADAIDGAGVLLIKANPELWADRGWRKLWDHIDANRINNNQDRRQQAIGRVMYVPGHGDIIYNGPKE